MLMNAIWKYKITAAQRRNRAAGFSDHLNQMGTEGWELVTIKPFKDVGVNIFYLKRPLVSLLQKLIRIFKKLNIMQKFFQLSQVQLQSH